MDKQFKNSYNINNRIIGKINTKDLLKFDIIVPNEQRIKDTDKIREIFEYQETYFKKHGNFNFIGVINIHVCNNTYYLVDGQHRYNAIKLLINKKYELIDIIVELVNVHSIDELKHNYILINKNTELPEFPETIDKNIPEKASQYFFDKYSNIWSTTKRVRRPHLNKNNFQEALGIITDKLNIKSYTKLQSIIEDYNEKLSRWPFENFPNYKTFKDPEKIKEKCKNTKLYLGLFIYKADDFCYNWVKAIIKEECGQELKSINKRVLKKKIPQKIRNDSWNKYIGKTIGCVKCICCNETEITQNNFEAGHIIPSSKGGENTLDNILPICSGCNRSMGNKNMDDYINTHYPNNLNFKNKKY